MLGWHQNINKLSTIIEEGIKIFLESNRNVWMARNTSTTANARLITSNFYASVKN